MVQRIVAPCAGEDRGWPGASASGRSRRGSAGRSGGRRLALAVIVALALVAAGVAPRAARADGGATVDTDLLNLRDGPGTWATVVDQMPSGASVDVLAGPTDDGWYKVSYQGEVGWAFGGYLGVDGAPGWASAAGADAAGGPSGAGQTAWVTTDSLRVRAGAGTDAAVIDHVGSGAQVTVTGREVNGFVPVTYGGGAGWVAASYLTTDGPPAAPGPEHWIDVNRSSQTVSLMVGNDAIASFWAAMGFDTSADGFYSTAIGTYAVFGMNADLTWTDWGHVFIRDWVGFDPDRHNGFHTYSLDAGGNVLPGGAGKTGGCVALEPSAADQLYAFAHLGMRVEVHF